jgi:hypothetical protein
MLSHVCDDDANSMLYAVTLGLFSRVITFNQKLKALVEIFSCAAGKCLLFIYRIGCVWTAGVCVFFFLLFFLRRSSVQLLCKFARSHYTQGPRFQNARAAAPKYSGCVSLRRCSPTATPEEAENVNIYDVELPDIRSIAMRLRKSNIVFE